MAYSETRFVEEGSAWRRAAGFVADFPWATGAVVFAVLFSAYILTIPSSPTLPPIASAHVKIDMPAGHGSATHIGDGLYVTAAHVVDGNSELTINGQPIAVLWSNKEYDIALLRGPDTAAFVPLACYTAAVGDVGQAHGNPMDLTDVTTTVTVAGEPREVGAWKLAMPMDGVLGPGMSGGGWVVGGALAGVNVAMAMAPASGFPSFYGISLVVPSSVVCDLMGRV